VEVQVRLAPIRDSSQGDRDFWHQTNEKALKVVRRLRDDGVTLPCQEHPNQPSNVVVMTHPEGHIELDTSGLCCDNYREAVTRHAEL
jgi:hypothetical protein